MSAASEVRSREGRSEENSRCLRRMENPRHHRLRAPSCSLSTVRASFHFDKCVNGFNACRETHQTSDISILGTGDYPRRSWCPLAAVVKVPKCFLSDIRTSATPLMLYLINVLPFASPAPFYESLSGYAFQSISSRCFSPHRFLHKAP